MSGLLQRYDVLLVPTLAQLPPPFGRIDDTHMGGPAGNRLGGGRSALEFFQRARQRHRVPSQLGAGRVGQKLPLATHGGGQKAGDDRRDQQGDEPKAKHDERQRIAALLAPAPGPARYPTPVAEEVPHQIRHQHDRSDHPGEQRHQPDVEVANVGHLVGNHRLEFVAVERSQEALSNGHVRHLRGIARGKRVGIRIRYDPNGGSG